MRMLKVLIIDDKKIVHHLFQFLLGFHGHHVTFLDDPLQAVAHLKTHTYDIVFLDIVMPGKDGVALLADVRKAVPDIPVVMMSGFTMEEKKTRALKLGALACLDKPFEREEFNEVIKRATGVDLAAR